MPLPDFRLSALPLRTVNSSRPRVAKSPRPKSVMSQPRRARMTSPARCLLRFQSSTDQLANSGSLNPKEAMNFSPSRMISFNSDRFMRYLQTRQPGARRVHAASYSEGRGAAPPSGKSLLQNALKVSSPNTQRQSHMRKHAPLPSPKLGEGWGGG